MRTIATLPRIGLLVVALALILAFPIHAVAQVCVPTPSGLVSWWNGGSVSGTTATDIADGNNGTISSSGVTLVPTQFGHSFQFDGVSGQIAMGNPANLNFGPTGTFALEAWFQWNGKTGISNVIRKSTYDSPGFGYWLRVGSAEVHGILEFFA
jgi:hypothetical protein